MSAKVSGLGNARASRRRSQSRLRHARQPALRLLGRGSSADARPARPRREALELRELDRALALQPADGAPAAHEPAEVYASEYYKQDFLRYSERLGIEGIEFKKLLPRILVPTYLKRTLGYSTHAIVSMPVLNAHTPINLDFDSYRLITKHNDMAAMLDAQQQARRRRP